jgi:hypothetical protein
MNSFIQSVCWATVVALAGCGRPADTHWKDGRYKVYATDSDFAVTRLGFDHSPGILGLVGPEVIAAGSDSKYVVVTRLTHPSDVTEYYIITKAAASDSEGVTSGPFTLHEYEAQKAALKLPNFNWSKRKP